MKKQLLDLLYELLAQKTRYCNGYKDSGDSGLCYSTDVLPIKYMIKYVEELEEWKGSPMGDCCTPQEAAAIATYKAIKQLDEEE